MALDVSARHTPFSLLFLHIFFFFQLEFGSVPLGLIVILDSNIELSSATIHVAIFNGHLQDRMLCIMEGKSKLDRVNSSCGYSDHFSLFQLL